ncbi:MAG TPA: hypothetical protein VFM81_02315 [Actinomycetota bacterium]|nr:hypothetical protein [Actinomycetota bacterium]
MNEGGNGSRESPEGLEAEVERLKEERQQLEARVETLEAKPEKRRRVRRIATPILVALSIIVFTVTVPAAWGARTVLNTDRYVATVAPLADDPAVQASIATKLTDQVFSALNVQGTLSDALAPFGERATLLAGPLTIAVKGFVRDQVEKVVASQAFRTFWVEANRFVHTQVLAILRGDTVIVTARDGKVLLNLLPLVNLALGSIEAVASDLVGRDVTLPTISASEVPSAAIAKLEGALGIDLPEDYGQIVVYDSHDLETLQQLLYTFERLLVLLLLLIPILAAASLLVSTRRRRTLIQLTVGAAIGLVIVRRIAIMSRDHLFDRVDTQRFPSVRVLTNELMASLFRYTAILLAIVLLTALVALITGPYPWAVTVRGWVRDGVRGVAAALTGERPPDTKRTRWIRDHRDVLMLGGAILALLLLWLFDLSLWGFVIAGIVIALYEIALARLGHEPDDAEVA